MNQFLLVGLVLLAALMALFATLYNGLVRRRIRHVHRAERAVTGAPVPART